LLEASNVQINKNNNLFRLITQVGKSGGIVRT